MNGQSLDQTKLTEFFNELELTEDKGDLDLLVEAERRGLLNEPCKQLLEEARRRGWVAPKEGSNGPIALYEVRYFGSSSVQSKFQTPAVDEVAASLNKITSNPRMAFQQMLLMEVHEDMIKCYDVSQDVRESSVASRTLRKIKSVTMRRLTGRKREGDDELRRYNTENAELVVEHDLKELNTFLSFEKIVTIITAEEDFTGDTRLLCHAYKCKDRRKALEVTDHLRRTKEGLLSRDEEKTRKLSPIQRVTLQKQSFGFGFTIIGAATQQEAATGIFISRIEPGGIADKHPMVHVGQQIMAINGENTEEFTMSEARQKIIQSGEILVLDLRDNPHGWGMYQYKLGINKPGVRFSANSKTDNLDVAVDDIFQKFLNLASDKEYSSPVEIVAGKAYFNF